MKAGIHPELKTITIHCNGCDTTFESQATSGDIKVEICSNCHPFYTGKQKLLDTAGRVDKFRARQEAASQRAEAEAKRQNKKDAKLSEIQDEIQSETVDSGPTTETAEA